MQWCRSILCQVYIGVYAMCSAEWDWAMLCVVGFVACHESHYAQYILCLIYTHNIAQSHSALHVAHTQI
jgi:hypothetical protein